MSLGEAFANWRCVCGRTASIEHPFGGYCSGKEVIEKLSAERDKLLANMVKRNAELIKANDDVNLLKARVESLEAILTKGHELMVKINGDESLCIIASICSNHAWMREVAEALKADEGATQDQA